MGSASPTQNAGPNRLDLREVIQVVSGVVHGDIPDRLCPALGMHAEQVPLLGAQRVQEDQVRLPQQPIDLQRQVDVRLIVTSRSGPYVLVERLDLRARGREDQANAVTTDEFIVREVGNQFPGATKGSAAASIS